ncbi:diguanylate cyclase/phosphodiesterase (GGDEF & EAL domains) with PAS/PAC sensor(s) [Deinococcus marmoris]|uniref:Diguanylate cyclase/phosphodiesterase (GGDEF & EAL domains) with PAS/PAC sensor(S) n=1 Tax=Deinococcus marmoris TaxID=249408 RepID=A0A1U7NV39_9DEIO|nr:diguanylate cyclase/phosphodiesterase (GGDEF & EAL domains) with PAS/PAC sensor(s) [Deinococcus marmoris]
MQDNTVVLDIEPEDERELLYQPVPSMLYVPLEVKGKRVGVLSVQSYEAGAFDETDLQFLQLLAQHVSIALENAALREELKQLTRTDALTGLLNRRAFDHDAFIALTTAQHEERPLNLAILDVHRFKQINDEFGHQAGDAVLATVGQILTQALPAPHAAFRLGGDEFALLVWGTPARLSELTIRLTHALRVASWPLGVGPICLHSGWAQWPEEGLDEWLSLADTRMYQAKRRRIEGRQVDWGLDFGENSPEELSQ